MWRALSSSEYKRAFRPAQMVTVQINLLITGLGGISYWIANAATGGKHVAIPFGQSVFRWLHRPILDIILCLLCILTAGMLQWRRLRLRRGAWSAILFLAGISFLAQSLIGYALRVPNDEVPPAVLYGYFAAWGTYLTVQSRRWSASHAKVGSVSGTRSPGRKKSHEERMELMSRKRSNSAISDAV